VTREAVARLEDEHFEPLRVAAERDGSREVQAALEYRDREAGRHDDVLTVSRIEEDSLPRAQRMCRAPLGRYERGPGKQRKCDSHQQPTKSADFAVHVDSFRV